MRVMVDVNVEQFSVDDLLGFALQVGYPNRNHPERIIKWLIRQYGRSLLGRMSEYLFDRQQHERS